MRMLIALNISEFGFVQGRNADALALYFGEDPARCPFEQGILGQLVFILKYPRHNYAEKNKKITITIKDRRKEKN